MYSDKNRRSFWNLTLKDILILICSAAVPLGLALYTSNMQKAREEADEYGRQLDSLKAEDARQQALYDRFLHHIYKLDKNGDLAENQTPWAFANAYYRAANRQWNAERKGDALQFLREHALIGRSDCSTGCRGSTLPDIIRVDELSLEYVKLISQTGNLNHLKLDCINFGRITCNHAIFSHVSLNGALFDGGRGHAVQFQESSLRCARFTGVDLQGVDFGDSDLSGTVFSNVNLLNAKFTEEQLKQAKFENCTLSKDVSDQIKLHASSRKFILQFCAL